LIYTCDDILVTCAYDDGFDELLFDIIMYYFMNDDSKVTFNFNVIYHYDGLLMLICIVLYNIWYFDE